MRPEWLYPLVFEPVYKDYVWGGNRIPHVFHRSVPPAIYAESWEIADRPEGMSVVVNGPLTGKSLHELVEAMGAALLGPSVHATAFPLLIKLIDARERLSVQVHPDDEAASRYGGEAKTEAWHVLQAQRGAYVFAGLRPNIDRQAFTNALAGGRLETCLEQVPVKKGDTIFIPGGRVHAIGEGCLLLEVQQNSDTTYRVYDWLRLEHDGRPRPLHVSEALRVIRWNDADPVKAPARPLSAGPGFSVSKLIACRYFRLEKISLSAPLPCRNDGAGFHVLFASEGNLRIEGPGFAEPLSHGTTSLLPAAVPDYTLVPEGAGGEVLRVSVPQAGHSHGDRA